MVEELSLYYSESQNEGKRMVELRAQEQQLLTTLESLGGKASVDQLIDSCKLPDTAVMRVGLTLQEKSLIKIQAQYQNIIKLTAEGEQYAKKGLPERNLIRAVADLGGAANLQTAAKKAEIETQFIQIALGWAIKKKWALYTSSDNGLSIRESLVHQAFIEEGSDETLLKYLNDKSQNQATFEDLSLKLKEAAEQIKKRRLITIEPKTARTFQITPEGKKAAAEAKIAPQEITQLTTELIITGKWHTSKLQKYNIEAPVAKTYLGKKHPYLQFLNEVREKLVNLGFQEMTGTAVETSFFNFDALFVPQDHPAREESDIYYLKDPQYGEIGSHAQAVEHVSETHEDGWETGSTGWGYKYSLLAAQRLILRGHGTCLSARTLEGKNFKVPSKHFSIARVYRPEITDKTHLSEFNQVEGIIIDENLNLKDLFGVLGKFAMEIAGADKVRFKPDYFPFTEPSVELSAYKEGCGWVEFGGSGIFRPEVTVPLGVKVPVIAWGLGVDRLFMMRSGIEDIRDIFSQNLDWLRKKQVT
ncbi:MAG TPA: phenylalanine--tRNA ligase subunit alpha [Candidatus Acidoferrum sp.]|nr:phenylalanine--tRNA ligase subunit alpha [Candidatus Acidoferrum sp.]